MLLTNLLMHIPFFRWLCLWWRHHQVVGAGLPHLVANPTRRKRQRDCLWCWKEKHPHAIYPSHLTSSMCVMHSQRQRAAFARSRAERRQELAV